MELTSAQRRELRARAHALHPVVAISSNGLTDSVLAEIDRSLKAHELIKIRTYGVERNDRDALLGQICATLGCAPVQIIGNLLVVYRERPEIETGAMPRPRKPATSGRATKKQLGGDAPAPQVQRRRAPASPPSSPRSRRATPNPPRRANTPRGR